MKNVKRVLAALIAIALLSLCIPQSVEAYSAPKGSVLNPINLKTGGKKKIYWGETHTIQSIYVNFEMKKQGYATISILKSLDDGKLVVYHLVVCDKKGNTVWDCDTSGQSNTSTKNYVYNVGLKKGKYSLSILPYQCGIHDGISSAISIKTTENSFWEQEENDSFNHATPMTLGKKYTGVYGECLNMGESDYYKFKLKKGKTYQIKIGNYGKLFADTTMGIVVDPSKNDRNTNEISYRLQHYGQVKFKAKKSGYYYVKIYNCCGSHCPGIKYTITVNKK